MFLRFTHLSFPSDKMEEAKAVYMNEVAPVIRKQKGNKQVLLLEPREGSEDFISFSLWEDESDIRAFEAGTEYPSVISRIKEIVDKPPVQKYYIVNS